MKIIRRVADVLEPAGLPAIWEPAICASALFLVAIPERPPDSGRWGPPPARKSRFMAGSGEGGM